MRALLKSALAMLATLVVASIIIFAVLALLPGDPAAFLASRENTRPSEASLDAIRHEFGLDLPMPVRYLNWMVAALHGDFGKSWLTGAQVGDLLLQRIGPTLLLGSAIFLIGAATTFLWGGLAGLRPGRLADRGLTLLSVAGTALPSFVLGLLAIRLFASGLGWVPVIGDGTLRTLAMPAIIGGIGLASYWARPFRALVAGVLGSDWVLATRARGVGDGQLLWLQVVPNALVGFLPFLGVGLAGALTGAVMIENVFSWPGLGTFVIDAIRRRDLPIVQAFAMLSVLFYVATTQLADLVGTLLTTSRSRSAA